MAEHIVDWQGIGATLVNLSNTKPPFLWAKYLRELHQKEPVVRCRDCKNAWTDELLEFDDDFEEYWRTAWFCTHPKTTEPGSLEVEPDGFCAWGERKALT